MIALILAALAILPILPGVPAASTLLDTSEPTVQIFVTMKAADAESGILSQAITEILTGLDKTRAWDARATNKAGGARVKRFIAIDAESCDTPEKRAAVVEMVKGLLP